MTEACDLAIVEAAAEMRSGALSSVELTRSCLDRLAAAESRLCAFVHVDPDAAIAAATRADAERRSGTEAHLLHGIPVSVKDIFDLDGVPTRCGSRVRDDAAPARRDAESVRRARAVGAIAIGKTVTQEFAAGVISDPARNPWDPTRIPGGSSGGTGASVASGSSLAGFGSDTGGSIRNPASVNGIVGLKPTYGRVSRRGVFPLAWSLDTVGPLARTVEDAAIFFDALAGHDPDDRGSSSRSAPAATSGIGLPLRGLRLGVERGFFAERLMPDVAAAFEEALTHFRAQGAEVIDVVWPEAAAARVVSFVINRVECVAVHDGSIRTRPELFGDELRLRLEANALYPAEGYLRALRARVVVKRSIAGLFAEQRLDALLTPACPGVAVRADDLFVRFPDGTAEPVSLAYTRLTMSFNATGQPAMSVPCGFGEQGLPIGLQIVGRPFDEAMVCRVGHAYERATGWYRRRPEATGSET